METASLDVKVAPNEVRIAEPPTISDPWQLMDAFYASGLYKKGYESFFERKSLAPDVTKKEMDKAYLESESAELKFLKFGENAVDFRYVSRRYPQNFVEAFAEYEQFLKDTNKYLRGETTKADLQALDATLFGLHSGAAKELVKTGMVPSINLGRALVSLISLSIGLKSPGEARTTTLQKIKNRYTT
jgi:hypothetical protein